MKPIQKLKMKLRVKRIEEKKQIVRLRYGDVGLSGDCGYSER